MNSDVIRQAFLEFFQSKGHIVMPSASLVPAGDPTLLFTSAGMVPLKPYFMGEATPPGRRLTSCQKSFRTTDVDEVGDHKHLTFFEMLGNFSIGDYFKKEAIAWGWEFVTQHLKLPPERLYITIYLDDEEAFQHWNEDIGVPLERIYRYGEKDNWWGPAGREGPCGPCSEIHYDGGYKFGCGSLATPDEIVTWGGEGEQPGCHPNCDRCERFVELWNLVFMQFYQDPDGNRTPLPAPSIDTGLGLERAAAILQGVRSLYETDLFKPIVDCVCQLTGKAYGHDRDTDYALRVVAEHSRAAAFLIADGVVPGNEGRGYVLRRIIRRAIRYGRRLGLDEPFLTQVAEPVIQRFQDAYPELSTNQDHIMRVVGLEEERFADAVRGGIDYLDSYILGVQTVSISELHQIKEGLEPFLSGQSMDSSFLSYKAPENVLKPVHDKLFEPGDTTHYDHAARPDSYSHGATALKVSFRRLEEAVGIRGQYGVTQAPTASNVNGPVAREELKNLEFIISKIPGRTIFILYDTYGFPPELTAEIAREHGLDVDMEGFQWEMEAQRKRAREAHAFTGAMEILPTYENLGVDKVDFVGYQHLAQGSVVTGLLVEGAPVGHATKGQTVEVVLGETPFYAEAGGQVGDAGIIAGPNGKVRVEDTKAPVAGLIVHLGVVEEGDISLGDIVEARVDPQRRQDTARNHSGTHLLHSSLRQVLGAHVRQAGSLVAPDRLRFDYSHISPLSRDELMEIQALVNQKVREDLAVSTRESSFAQAVQEGALAFFGDKYGDVIRVVEMSDGERFSLEVCGGTHVKATGQIGPLFVVGESSIGGGMRRIEAVTGGAAEQLFVDRSGLLESLSRKLQTPLVDLELRMDSFIQEVDHLRKQVAALERENLRREAQDLLARVMEVDGMKVLAAKTSASSAEAMREMGDWLKARLSSAVIVLGAVKDNQPTIVTMITPDLVERGLHAGNIAKEAARVMEGGGGGRPEMGQAGGKRADKLEEALRRVPEVVRKEFKP